MCTQARNDTTKFFYKLVYTIVECTMLCVITYFSICSICPRARGEFPSAGAGASKATASR